MTLPATDTGCLNEQTMQDLLGGHLLGQALSAAERHLASCFRCAQLAGEAGRLDASAVRSIAVSSSEGPPMANSVRDAANQEPTLVRGTTVGRYVVLDLIGRGGMGEVYAAYDPELERKVALKVLRVEIAIRTSPAQAAERMRREAKAVAKLSHPNVVVVYEAGVVGDRVFIAMEYVEGQTISEWLRAVPRSQAEILRVFVAAGRGLAAAHAAGIVHRDFKPQNVMIGAGDQVRVMDFGMASLLGDAPPDASGAASGAPGNHVPGDSGDPTKLTRTGAVLGTPAYMAPEQFRGGPAEPRTDQYSFCVGLYEALFGARPGQQREPKERAASPAKRVPAWLRALLDRGLHPGVEQRFPSMDALLTTLEATPTRRKRIRWALVAVAGAAALLTGFIATRTPRSAHLCRAGAERIAAVWETTSTRGSRRSAAERAFLASGVPDASDRFSRTTRILDQFTSDWVAQYTDACEATHTRGEQSPALLDLRMSCFQGQLGELRVLGDLFKTADSVVVGRSIDAALALPSPTACKNVKALQFAVPPPGPTLRDRVARARERLSEAKVFKNAGRFQTAHERFSALADEARALVYGPLIAEVDLEYALSSPTDYVSYDHSRRRSQLERAMLDGEASGHDEVVAKAAAQLVWVAQMEGKREQAWFLDAFTEAALRRLGGHEHVWSWLFSHRCELLGDEGRYAEALSTCKQALSFAEKAGGRDHPDLVTPLDNLAGAFLNGGQPQAALATVNRAIDILTRAYGQTDNLSLDYTRGMILTTLGRCAEAETYFETSLSSITDRLGPQHPNAAFALTGHGLALLCQQRSKSAIPPLEGALKLRTASPSPIGRLPETQFALARALWDAGSDRPRAVQLAKQASSGYATIPGLAAKFKTVDDWLRCHTPAASRP